MSISTLLLLGLSLAVASVPRPTYAATSNAGVVIPLYNYPDSTWTTIANAAKANPNVPIIAVINPNNGPGSSQDPTYLAGVQNLQAAGVMVLGYVATGYATSSYSAVSSVESLANDYKVWYHVNGIMFDEMSNDPTYESYYSTLNSYVKSDGMTYTMGNPGTSVPSGYIGILNSLCIYENAGYPSLSFITYAGYPSSDFAFIAYGVSYNGAFVASAAPLVGYMYIDDLSGGNPYSTLSSLFTQTVATLAAADPPTSTSTTSSTTTTSTSISSSTSTTSVSTTTSAADPLLSISTVSTSNQAMPGFYIESVTDNTLGTTTASGLYTPQTVSGVVGHSYSVTVDDYGSNYVQGANMGTFTRTAGNGGGGTATFTLQANSNLVFTMGTSSTTTTSTTTSTTSTTTTKTSTTSTSSSATGSWKLKITSTTTTGTVITGFWTALHNQAGKVVGTGYTPKTYTLKGGQIYIVEADSYGSCQFNHWQDNGNTNYLRTISITSNTNLVAVYSC